MRRCPLALLAALALFLVGDHAVLAVNAQTTADNCDPQFRKNNPDLERAREAKKAALRRRGYPERFMKLIDKEECLYCLSISPDSFGIMFEYKDNDYAPADAKTGSKWTSITYNWTPGLERQAREQTANGTIKGFYILHTLSKCLCCPEMLADFANAETQSDWDEDLGANTSHLIPFDQANLGPLPDDLVNPDDRFIGTEPVPVVRTFHKPPKKQAHARCQSCQGLAEKLNAEYDTRDSIWDDAIRLMRGMSIAENAIARRANEILRMRYKQQFASSRTEARDKEIADAEHVNEMQKQDLEKNHRDLAELGKKVAEANANIDKLEKALLDCESKCVTETIVTAQTNATNTFTPLPVEPATAAAVTPGGTPAGPVAECDACSGPAGGVRTATLELAAALKAVPPNQGLIDQWRSRLRDAQTALGRCNASCKKPAPPPPPPPPVISPPPPAAKCQKCEQALAMLNKARGELAKYQQETPPNQSMVSFWQKAVNDSSLLLNSCNRECDQPTNVPAPALPPTEVFAPPPPACFGDSCGNEWNVCESNDSCPPVEEDCRIPGVCEELGGGGGGGGFAPLVNPTDGFTWTPPNIQIEIRIQIKVVDLLNPALYPQFLQQVPGLGSALVIPPAQRQGVRQWFDPLGLLARRMVDQIERWRGSVGPRPLIKMRDLELIDRVSNVQAAGLPKGVHVLLTDQGGSTGKTLVMNILNLAGQPVRLSSKPFAVQPIQPQAQPQVMQAFSRLSQAAPVRLDLAAYCVEFLKAPPGPGTLLRLAPPDIQQKYSSMSKVLQSAYRVANGHALHPDSNPAAYTDSMKQWSIWVVEQNLNEARFTEAFLGHTKKNVEAAKQQWSKQAEDMIRAASPNRWRDIVKILQGAGVPVPR